jgi:hypothetical protein
MALTLNIFACLLAILGALIIVMNWGCAIVSLANRYRGIDRHHSVVPLVAQILFILADLVSSFASHRILSSRVLFVAGLTDISLLWLLGWPFILLFHRLRTPK